MFRIYHHTKIYILCPANAVSGGPEAIHQLIHKLRKFGHEAYIVYLPTVEDPRPAEYRNYEVDHVAADYIEDSAEHILIVPEVWPHMLRHCRHIQKGIWWLSAHNFPREAEKQFQFSQTEKAEVVHLAQSRYAEHFLFRQGARYVHPLTDYLNRSHFQDQAESGRQDRVLYSIKGWGMVEKLKLVQPAIKWVALENMSPQEVRSLMADSKVYVDFGFHPGKDRMPREAAVNGCCVIVGMRGAAVIHQDIPIPNAYKFNMDPFDMAGVILTIEDCMLNYEKRIKDFESYIRTIQLNEVQFEIEVRQIFGVRAH
jgi:hypothetical protein